MAPLRHAKQVADWHSESLMQAALAKFMLDGDFAKYLRRMHKEYAARRNALLRHLRGPLAQWLALPWRLRYYCLLSLDYLSYSYSTVRIGCGEVGKQVQ